MNSVVQCRRNETGTLLRQARAVVLLLLVCGVPSVAWADVTVRIERARQRMSVDVNGVHYASWPVSTARRGYITPPGVYSPYSLQRMHYSRRYDYTPMPYSIFFTGGYAIHGTSEVRKLGRPVSHGCVRLRPDNARMLFRLVSQHGMGNTRIVVH